MFRFDSCSKNTSKYLSFLKVWKKQGWPYTLTSVFKYLKIIKIKDQLIQMEIPINRYPITSRILTKVQLVLFLLPSEFTITNRGKFGSLLRRRGISEQSYKTQLSFHSAEQWNNQCAETSKPRFPNWSSQVVGCEQTTPSIPHLVWETLPEPLCKIRNKRRQQWQRYK